MSDVERLTYRITEAAEAIGVSRTKMYEMVASGEVPSVKLGKSVRIPVQQLKAWLNRRVDEKATA
jgi:excisionase family DNA binding protein